MTAATTPGIEAVDRILDLLDELEQVVKVLKLAAEQWEEDGDDRRRC